MQVAVPDEERPRLAPEFRLRVGRVPDDEYLSVRAAEHDGLVPRRVARCRDESDRPVAEDIEGSGEAGERLDRLGFVVDGSPVEGVVELAVVVAVPEATRLSGRPFTAIDEKRGVGEFGDGARMVDMEVGHDHDPHIRELDPASRQLDAERLVVLHPGEVHEPGGPPHVAGHVVDATRVEAGVDHQRTGTRVLDKERGDRQPLPAASGPEELRRDLGQRQAAVRSVGECAGRTELGGEERVQADRRAGAAALKREVRRLGLGGERHGSRTLYRLRAMAILRDNLLAGRIVATNTAADLREALEALGAEVVDAGGAGGGEPGGALDALVHDARADFAGGGQNALLAALETLWEQIASAANASLIPSGDGGKVVLIAPEDGAGAYADAARAAIENLARTLSTEWARYGITATALTPRAGTRESDLAVLVAFIVSGAGDYYSGARFDLGAR